jgi:hypothetical protein
MSSSRRIVDVFSLVAKVEVHSLVNHGMAGWAEARLGCTFLNWADITAHYHTG